VDPEIIVLDVNDPEVAHGEGSHPVQKWFGTQGQLPLSGDTQRGIETPTAFLLMDSFTPP